MKTEKETKNELSGSAPYTQSQTASSPAPSTGRRAAAYMKKNNPKKKKKGKRKATAGRGPPGNSSSSAAAGSSSSTLAVAAAATAGGVAASSASSADYSFGNAEAPATPLAMLRLKYTLLGKEEWWFLMDETLGVAAAQLRSKNYVVIDGLLGDAKCRRLRAEVQRAEVEGKLKPGVLAGGKTGKSLAYAMEEVRGDLVGWFDGGGGKDGEWVTLAEYLKKVDTLVSELGQVPGFEGLGNINNRSNAMTTCYPGGSARYVRHCDNQCNAGQGPNCNGRRLTALYYLNPGWKQGDGGELKLYKPMPKHDEQENIVAPVGDRLVLFWADYRVPHEVLPAATRRYAVSLWYFDHSERKSATAFDDDGDDGAAAKEKIRREIAKFEQQFTAKAKIVEDAQAGTEVPKAAAAAAAAAAAEVATDDGEKEDGERAAGAPNSATAERETEAKASDASDVSAAAAASDAVEIAAAAPAAAAPAAAAPAPAQSHVAATRSSGPVEPSYRIAVAAGTLSAVLDLPLLGDFSAAELDMSRDALVFKCPLGSQGGTGAAGSAYLLSVKLPKAVDSDQVQAKYKRKKRQLTVSAPVL